MSLFSQKQGPGLSINTAAANSGGSSLFGSGPNQASSSGSLFGNTAKSQPQASGGLFGNLNQTSQSQSSGGLFGNSAQQASQPAQSGGLFSNLGSAASSSQPQASGGLFGNTQTSQGGGGGLFGNTQNASSAQPVQTGGLFGNLNKLQPPQSTGLFGTGNASQPQQTSSLFGGSQTQPAAPQAQPSGFSLGGLGVKPSTANASSLLGGTTLGASTTSGNQAASQSSTVKINIEHLRTTTRFEQLTDDLQKEIELLDMFILQQMTFSHEVSDLLPAVAAGGANIPNDVTFVSDKLEQLELGLENDATEINSIKDKVVVKDAAEAKLCFRAVDRLKMPAQYQQQQLYQSVNGTSAGGLSGWWNHPQTLQRSVRGTSSAGGRRNLQLPGDDDEAKGPSDLVDFFEKRTADMNKTLAGYKNIMQEIETHLDGVEMSISMKQRELNDSRSSGGVMGRGADEKVRNLRYALGVFERSIYDVAERVGTAREGVQELGMGALQTESRLGQSRLAW